MADTTNGLHPIRGWVLSPRTLLAQCRSRDLLAMRKHDSNSADCDISFRQSSAFEQAHPSGLKTTKHAYAKLPVPPQEDRGRAQLHANCVNAAQRTVHWSHQQPTLSAFRSSSVSQVASEYGRPRHLVKYSCPCTVDFCAMTLSTNKLSGWNPFTRSPNSSLLPSCRL